MTLAAGAVEGLAHGVTAHRAAVAANEYAVLASPGFHVCRQDGQDVRRCQAEIKLESGSEPAQTLNPTFASRLASHSRIQDKMPIADYRCHLQEIPSPFLSEQRFLPYKYLA